MVQFALEAAAVLAGRGTQVAVVDMFSIKPLDEVLVRRMAAETGALVTAEEHNIIGGLGSAVCEVTAGGCPVPVIRVGVEDEFGQSGTPDELLAHYGLTVDNLVRAVEDSMSLKR